MCKYFCPITYLFARANNNVLSNMSITVKVRGKRFYRSSTYINRRYGMIFIQVEANMIAAIAPMKVLIIFTTSLVNQE